MTKGGFAELLALVVLASCATKKARPQPVPKPPPVDRAYARVQEEQSADACRAYLNTGRTEHRAEVQAIYDRLKEESRKAAAEQDTDLSWFVHVSRFPEDKERSAEAREELRKRRRAEVAATKRVRLELDYRERGKSTSLPADVDAAIRELVACAGIEVADAAPMTLRITGKGDTRDARYSQGYVRKNGISVFSGEMEVRHANGFLWKESISVEPSTPPPALAVRKDAPKEWDGGRTPSEGIQRSRLVRLLLGFLVDLHGDDVVLRALGSTNGKLFGAAMGRVRVSDTIAPADWIARVRPGLRSDDVGVRARAVKALEEHIRTPADEDEALSFFLFADRAKGPVRKADGLSGRCAPIAAKTLRAGGGKPPINLPQHSRSTHDPCEHVPGPSERAALLLCRMGEPGLEALVEALERGDAPPAVAWALARMGDPAQAALRRIALDPKSPARPDALEVLSLMGVFLPTDGLPEPRATRIASRRSRHVLESNLRIGADFQRAWAVRTLIGVQDPEVFPLLLKALQDDDEDVRYHAAVALGALGDRKALPALQGLSQERRATFSVRSAILRIEEYGK